MTEKRAHVWISGRVQGVFFRHYTQEQALRLGLKGWVRNLPDGRVEATFQGDPSSVETMIQWCWHGPPMASVNDVEVAWEESDPGIKGFNVRYA